MCQKPCKGQIYAEKKQCQKGGKGVARDGEHESVDKVHDDAFKYFMP